jgi:hypothetical protein
MSQSTLFAQIILHVSESGIKKFFLSNRGGTAVSIVLYMHIFFVRIEDFFYSQKGRNENDLIQKEK